MKAKIICILVMMLLITTTISVGENINKIINEENNILDHYTNSEYYPGELIVKFKKSSSLSNPSILRLNHKYKVTSIEKVFRRAEGTNLENIYLLHVPQYFDIISIVNDYNLCSDVIYAEPNYNGFLPVIPNDEYFSLQWPLRNTGQYGGTPGCDIDAVDAWDIEKGSSDIVIASVDSGVDYYHEDIASNIWNNDDETPDNGIDDDNNGYVDDIVGWDFIENDNTPLDNVTAPQYGHGTRCAGIHSALTNNNIGVAGVTWYCKTMVVRCYYDHYDTTKYANGIIYAADNGADVINIEMGISSSSQLLKEAVDYAYGKGCFLCAPAGNANSSTPTFPAAFENVTAVGATNQRDERCDEDDWGGPGHGSNWGDWLDVAAPGNGLWLVSPGDEYVFFGAGGTSLSSPHVAGLAGLLLSQNPSRTPDEIKSLICTYVDPYISEYYIGTGRINAYKALISPPKAPEINGPTIGDIGVEYEYTFVSIDPDEHDLYYFINWGDGNVDDWFGPFDSGMEATASHAWDEKGTYTIKAKAKDYLDIESEWSKPFDVLIGNQPPEAPTINGPISGEPGKSYNYKFKSVDPDGDNVKYHVDWDDGFFYNTSLMPSGQEITISHTWATSGKYNITVYAEDELGNIGPSSSYQVTMPRDKAINNPFLNWLQSHPNMFPLIQKLIQQQWFGL